MKKLYIILILVLAGCIANADQVDRILKHASKGAVPTHDLQIAIRKVAIKYKQDPVLIAKIVMLESGGIANAENKVSNDYGIMQLNRRTSQLYFITEACVNDWRCNLDAGVMILADLSRYETFRLCSYNIGPRRPKAARLIKCLKYEQKLASIN